MPIFRYSFFYCIFIKHIQCVLEALPDLCPNSGRTPIISSILLTGIRVSFHLNISTPFMSSTRMHSSKPCFISSCHLNLRSVPYFCAIYAPSLELSKCGGSKTTSLNERSGYGIAVKSATTSGWTSSLRPSHRMYSASRISWKGHSDVSCQTRTSYCRSKRPISFSFHPFLIWLPVYQIIYCYKYFVCYPWVYGVTEGVSSVHPVGNPINHSIQFGVISDGLKPALEIHAVR